MPANVLDTYILLNPNGNLCDQIFKQYSSNALKQKEDNYIWISIIVAFCENSKNVEKLTSYYGPELGLIL